MVLEEEDADTVDRLVHWVYTKKCKIASPDENHNHGSGQMDLAKLYVCADRYAIVPLKNYVIDCLYMLWAYDIDPLWRGWEDFIRYLYSNTSTGSSIRRLFVAWWAWLAPLKEIERNLSIFTTAPEFGAEMVVAFGVRLQDPKQPNPLTKGAVHFYDNVDGPSRMGGNVGPTPPDPSN